MTYLEMLENYGKGSITIDGVTFFSTCSACPEQYDAYYEGKEIGYVRLRWGRLSASYPNVRGVDVYGFDFQSDWQGEFESDEQRMYHLSFIAASLKNAKHSAEVQGVL